MLHERDERAHEHEHGERKGKGHVQEPQSQPDEHRVDCRDDRGSANKAAQHVPRSLPGQVNRLPRLRREALQDPRPELRAVPKDEVEDGNGQDEPSDEADPAWTPEAA